MSSVETSYFLDHEGGSSSAPPKKSKFGLAAFGAVSSITAALVAVTIPFVVPAFRRVCLPYVPATPAQIENILAAVPKRHEGLGRLTIAEVGSGDGRVAVAICKEKRHQVVGLELNPWLVWFSRYKAFAEGCPRGACTFRKADLWKVDYGKFDQVVVFGVEEMMAELEVKLSKEMKPGSEVVACRFHLPTMAPRQTIGEGIDSVWVYKIS